MQKKNSILCFFLVLKQVENIKRSFIYIARNQMIYLHTFNRCSFYLDFAFETKKKKKKTNENNGVPSTNCALIPYVEIVLIVKWKRITYIADLLNF